MKIIKVIKENYVLYWNKGLHLAKYVKTKDHECVNCEFYHTSCKGIPCVDWKRKYKLNVIFKKVF